MEMDQKTSQPQVLEQPSWYQSTWRKALILDACTAHQVLCTTCQCMACSLLDAACCPDRVNIRRAHVWRRCCERAGRVLRWDQRHAGQVRGMLRWRGGCVRGLQWQRAVHGLHRRLLCGRSGEAFWHPPHGRDRAWACAAYVLALLVPGSSHFNTVPTPKSCAFIEGSC